MLMAFDRMVPNLPYRHMEGNSLGDLLCVILSKKFGAEVVNPAEQAFVYNWSSQKTPARSNLRRGFCEIIKVVRWPK
jgi:hypothetical protein